MDIGKGGMVDYVWIILMNVVCMVCYIIYSVCMSIWIDIYLDKKKLIFSICFVLNMEVFFEEFNVY